MKAYTDIEQSKKLAEILPLESADMSINHSLFHNMTMVLTTPYKKLHEFFSGDTPDTTLPCWSLAALLDVYPVAVGKDLDMYCCWQNSKNLCSKHYDNPVDAAVEMILRLHEEKLL